MKYSWNLKKTIIVILSALFAVCIMFAGITANKANANTDLETVNLSSTMQESAEMRLTNPTGMRFITNVNTADLELFNADNVKVVTMITQKNLLDAKGISVEDFNKDSDVKKGEVTFTAAKLAGIEAVEGKIKLIATLMEVNDVNITKEYVAKTYITDGEKIGYIGNATQASIFEVATYWKEQGLGAEDETTQAILDRYTKCDHVKYVNGACAACGTKCAHDWDGADCTICDMTREPSVADTTYSVEYLALANGAVTVDLESINETVVADEITAVAVNGTAAEWTVDDNGDLVITTATYGENVAVAITVANAEEYKTVTFKTIFATHVLSDETTFKGYFGKRQANTYAVISQSFNVAESPEIRPESSGAQYDKFTVNGLGHTVNGIYDYSGMFPTCLASGTLKNLTFGLKGYDCALSDEIGDFTLDNVTLNVTVPGGASIRLLGRKILSGRTFTIKDSNINFRIDANNKQKQYVFVATLDGNINIINSDIYSNGTMVLLGETYNGSAYGSGKIAIDAQSSFEDNYDTVTYADQYVTTDGSTITVDASKINGATVTGVTSAIVGSTTCSASQSGNTISINSSIKGETKLQLVAGNKTYIVGDIIVANFVLSDEATFKAWATAGNGTAGSKYAVISQDITLTADIELNTPWFGGWTLNGLGHTVKNIYDYSGFMPGGAGGVTIKNVTLNMKTCSSAFGDDWYGTNNFENVKITVSVPGHAGTSRLLFDRVRADTVFNFKNCEFTFNIDSKLQAKEMLLMKFDNSGIVVNFTNSTIKSTGTIAALNSSIKLDATSSITDKNGTK